MDFTVLRCTTPRAVWGSSSRARSTALHRCIDEAGERGPIGGERLRPVMKNHAGIVTSDFGLCVIHVGEDPSSEPCRHALCALEGEIDTEFHTLIEARMVQGWIIALAKHDFLVATIRRHSITPE